MKKVVAKPRSAYFADFRNPDWWRGRKEPFHFSHLYLFNPLAGFLVVLGFCALGALFNRHLLILFFTLATFLWLMYIVTKTVAHGLYVKRVIGAEGRIPHEKDEILFKYLLSNSSGFSLLNFTIVDFCGAAQESHIEYNSRNLINSRSQKFFRKKIVCDGGMGQKKVGPLKVLVRDPLGIFEFAVVYDEVDTIEVLPEIQPLIDKPQTINPLSASYGMYESPQAGHNVNFTGVRPYQHGDSLRHIAWKLSARKGELLVKEFEKSINSDLNVVLNFDPEFHVGVGSHSTWEVMRDVALSFVSQQLEKGHRARLFTNLTDAEAGQGEDQLHAIVRALIDLKDFSEQFFTPEDRPETFDRLLERVLISDPRRETVILISPMKDSEYKKIENWCGHLNSLGCRGIVIFIDPHASAKDVPKAIRQFSSSYVPVDSPTKMELFAKLSYIGFYCYELGETEAIRHLFTEKVVGQ